MQLSTALNLTFQLHELKLDILFLFPIRDLFSISVQLSSLICTKELRFEFRYCITIY